jgi:hypothetical protein
MSDRNDATVVRVPDSELDFDEDSFCTHNGVPFTGVGYEDVPGRGLSEVTYRDGFQEGPARDWFPSGALKAESYFKDNVYHGPSREFDEEGRSVLEEFYEYGILVESVRKDSSGKVTDAFVLDPDNPNFALLERYRRTKGTNSVGPE